jgi:hypothetical protein
MPTNGIANGSAVVRYGSALALTARLPGRLMVGQRPLTPRTLVRVQPRQPFTAHPRTRSSARGQPARWALASESICSPWRKWGIKWGSHRPLAKNRIVIKTLVRAGWRRGSPDASGCSRAFAGTLPCGQTGGQTIADLRPLRTIVAGRQVLLPRRRQPAEDQGQRDTNQTGLSCR